MEGASTHDKGTTSSFATAAAAAAAAHSEPGAAEGTAKSEPPGKGYYFCLSYACALSERPD